MVLNFENSQFLTALTQKVLQGIKKSFENAYWDMKIYWILPDTLGNSTTVTMLTFMLCNIYCQIGLQTFPLQYVSYRNIDKSSEDPKVVLGFF